MIETLPRVLHVERSMILGQRDEVLFVQRTLKDLNDPDRGLWELPGGKLEEGEDLEMGRMREALEETGLITGRIPGLPVDMQVDMSEHHSGELRKYAARASIVKQIGGSLLLQLSEVENAIFMPPLIAYKELNLTSYSKKSVLNLGQLVTDLYY